MPRQKRKKRRIQRLIIYMMVIFTLWIGFDISDYEITPYRALREAEKYSFFQSQQVLKKIDLDSENVILLAKRENWYSVGYIRRHGMLWKSLDAVIGEEIEEKDFMAIKDTVLEIKDPRKLVVCYGIVYDQSITKITAVNGKQSQNIILGKERHFIFAFPEGTEYTTITAFDEKEQLVYERGYH